MKKAFTLLVGLCLLGIAELVTSSALADCGKIPIQPAPYPLPPLPPPPPPVVQCSPKVKKPPKVQISPEIWNKLQQKQKQELNNVIENVGNSHVNVVVNVDAKLLAEALKQIPGWPVPPDPIPIHPGTNVPYPTPPPPDPNDRYPDGYGTVLPPQPTADRQGGAAGYGNKTFYEGQQQAVIAWNGKTDASGEETLILTTNEASVSEKPIAMLSVLPLPGKPISIERSNVKVFVMAKALLNQKIQEQRVATGTVGGYGVIMSQKIGSHNIFVWEMEDISKFEQNVKSYIATKYNNKAAALLTPEALKVVKSYHDRGFRYFAFDLTLVEGQSSTKEAIAYRFKSTFAYYPLAISAIGGTGHGLIDLIVLTPGKLDLAGAFQGVKVPVKGNTSVDFTLKEVNDLDPQLAAVFNTSGLNSVLARDFLIETDDIGSFKDDFIAIPVK